MGGFQHPSFDVRGFPVYTFLDIPAFAFVNNVASKPQSSHRPLLNGYQYFSSENKSVVTTEGHPKCQHICRIPIPMPSRQFPTSTLRCVFSYNPLTPASHVQPLSHMHFVGVLPPIFKAQGANETSHQCLILRQEPYRINMHSPAPQIVIPAPPHLTTSCYYEPHRQTCTKSYSTREILLALVDEQIRRLLSLHAQLLVPGDFPRQEALGELFRP